MKTDAQRQDGVMAELEWEPSVHAAQIGVEAQGGVVTLAGEVDSYAEKCSAERAAQRVSGVKALAVEMTVKIPGYGKPTDADIARSVQTALRSTTIVPADSVKVMVEHGWVTLSGEVDWKYKKQTASEVVRYLAGVTGVSDQIDVKPGVVAGDVKSDIEAALKRRARTDARDVVVDVHGADVTLTGTVHSWSERELATDSAWGAPGVRNVVDKMTLVD